MDSGRTLEQQAAAIGAPVKLPEAVERSERPPISQTSAVNLLTRWWGEVE